jgi:hypothetical protein
VTLGERKIMATSIWATTVKIMREHIVRIETPSGHGTGFVVPAPKESEDPCIITAWHVVKHAEEWKEPIKLTHFPSGKQAFLKTDSRIVNPNPGRDQAIIQFSATALPLPSATLTLPKVNTHYNEGVEIGWLGYPSVAPSNLCFFCGHVSTWLDQDEAYLVDGVAINGVSGGPAFYQDEKGNPIIIGLVTEYHPNVSTGKALPGVSLVRSINPLLKHYTEVQQKIKEAKVQDIPSEQPQGETPTA